MPRVPSLRSIPFLALLAAALISAACGGSGPAGPASGDPGDPGATPSIGGDVGNIAPGVSLLLRDGSTTSLTEAAAGKPALLYFFATWWAVCRAEFRTLKDVYPEYAGDVVLIGVGFDSSQSIEELGSYQDANKIPWIMAEVPGSIVRDFGVRTQSTKLGIQPGGLITFRKGYSNASPDEWRERLEALASGG